MKHLFVFLSVLFLTSLAYGQVEKSDDIYQSIANCDSLLFSVGFNTCDIDILEELISSDFTFFHDQAGITESKSAFIEGIENGLCKLPYKAIRIKKESSFEIYPLKSGDEVYGAIQHGEHQFYAQEGENQKYMTSTAKFTHVWVKEKEGWKLRSALSYDHVEVAKTDPDQ